MYSLLSLNVNSFLCALEERADPAELCLFGEEDEYQLISTQPVLAEHGLRPELFAGCLEI